MRFPKQTFQGRSPAHCCRVSLFLALAVTGCGETGPKRYHLAGKVTLAGQPVPAGQIFFDPDISKGNDGPAGFAFIKNGTYDTRLDGRAHVGGAHQVRIQAFDGKPGSELPLGRMLVPEFSTTADLPKQKASQDFDVPRK
jgi:hypothetical protein